jgi:hypothetical protein
LYKENKIAHNDSKIVKNLIYNWYTKEVINQMKGVKNVIWTK